MPVRYEITEKSKAAREKMLSICKKPKTLKQIAAGLGKTAAATKYNINQLIESGHLKINGTSFEEKHWNYNYIATNSTYRPDEQSKMLETVIQSIAIQEKISPIRSVSSNDYHTTKAICSRISAWARPEGGMYI